MKTERVVEVACPRCGQKGTIKEIETYEVPDSVAPGECADDMAVYFYQFIVLEGNFRVKHNDPNRYEHEVICLKCGETFKGTGLFLS